MSLAAVPRVKMMAQIINGLKLDHQKILDLGCFDGSFSFLLNGRNDYLGLETSEYAIKLAKKNGIKVKKFFIEDGKTFPFANNTFDLIVAGEIVEHIYDTDFFLNEIHRLLKPTGYLLITTPNIASLGRRLMLLFGINPIIESTPNETLSSGHIRYFTFESLKLLLEKHDFKITLSGSDVVNFSPSQRIRSMILAKKFPTLGQSLIVLANR